MSDKPLSAGEPVYFSRRYGFCFLLALVFSFSFGNKLFAEDSLLVMKTRILENARATSPDYKEFAEACLQANDPDLFLSTYWSAVESGKKALVQADLDFLYAIERSKEKIRQDENRFYFYFFTGKILAKYHLDKSAPLTYYTKALEIAIKLNDKCRVLRCYHFIEAFYMNISHDLIKVNEYITIMDNYIRQNNLNAIDECEVDLNVTCSVMNWYLENYDKGIEFLDKSIRLMQHSGKPKRLFDLYVRRSYFESLNEQDDLALKSLDSAGNCMLNDPGKAAYYNTLYADSFNIYVKRNDFPMASLLRKKVRLKDLDVANDEYYDYLYHLIKFNIHQGEYAEADTNIRLYKQELKEWNIQRWKNAYETQYILSKTQNNFTDALRYFEQFSHYNDLVHRQRQNFIAMGEQIKYQTLQKERQLNLQIAINEAQKERTRLLVAVFTGLCLFLLLLLAYRAIKGLREKSRMNKQFAEQLITNTEKERNRLAAELHDGLGQELLILKSSLTLSDDKEKAEKVGAIIETVRGMSRELYPVLLETIGLAATIENQLDKIDSSEDVFISSTIDYQEKMNKNVELQVFRIFQEAMTNVLKYAGASSVFVSLAGMDGKLSLTVKDNGIGFDSSRMLTDPKCFGLQSMKKRAESIGASLEISSKKNHGTEVRLSYQKRNGFS